MITKIQANGYRNTSLFSCIRVEVSADGSMVRYQFSFYSTTRQDEVYRRASHWQAIKYSSKGLYFIYHGRREYFDNYLKIK